jgi:hypothetical protein
MAIALPEGWWGQVLDGFIYEVDLNKAPCFSGLAAVRAGAYREAELRRVNVSTSKVNNAHMLIQAHQREQRGIGYPDPDDVRDAPPTLGRHYEQLRLPCDCGEPHAAGFHPAYCASWRVYQEPGPLWPKKPNAYELGLVAACTCELGNDVSTGHPPTCAVWG